MYYTFFCLLQKTTGFELYTLELVVQVGSVRQWTDKTHIVFCNYEAKAAEDK